MYNFKAHQFYSNSFSAIKWNFTKFIIDKNGQPVERIATTTDPFVSLFFTLQFQIFFY